MINEYYITESAIIKRVYSVQANSEENEDAETLANIEKYEDRLKYFIKK